MSKLKTPKRELFCKEYIIDLNGAQAAIRAGYSQKTANSIASEMLTKPDVQARIAELTAERMSRVKVDADYVLNRLVEIDQMDVADILNDDGSMKAVKDWPKVWRTTLSGLDVLTTFTNSDEASTESVLKKIKWPDKVKNLELIGRHISVGAFDKKPEEPQNQKPIEIRIVDAMRQPDD